MIIGKASSLANPLGMSAYATYGVKPAVGAYVVFSVGATGDNKSNAIDGSVPHISISDGIAIFDVPQTNQLLGIGDKVTHASGVCYLLSKITQSQWIVTTATGSLAPDLVSTLVTSITKTSNSLYSLFNGGALNALLGTYDLVTSDLQVHVTCYDHSDTAIAPVMIDSWVTDQ